MSKHSRDEYGERPGPSKRRKYDKASSIVESMEEIMEGIKNLNPEGYPFTPAQRAVPRVLLETQNCVEDISSKLGDFKQYLRDAADIEALKLGADASKRMNLHAWKTGIESLAPLAHDLQEALIAKPPPSEYAKASVWKECQAHSQPILCLRPTDKHGLPLVLLHQVFSRFQQLSRQPLPNLSTGADALRVALRLCSRMGEAFGDDRARGMAFDDAVGGYLQGVHGAPQLYGYKAAYNASRVYRLGQRCTIFREDKVEMGTGGDPYTQVARTYDLACERMEKNGVIPDAPVFLLCIVGPTLVIAGGFKDGEDTVVEPLSPTMFMLKDMDSINGRAMHLATHLFALRACLEQLPLLPNPASPVSGVPRVFTSFRHVKGTECELTFQRRLSSDQLLFLAVDGISRQVCVKIVYGGYGEEVHQALGDAKMAPELLGISRIEGGPTMIVMEMMNDSWQTLYTFAQRNPRWTAEGVKSTIRKRLNEILAKLKGERFVHGDFRANNIMVKPGREESAVVIDFDWAGRDGEVHYPLYRNDEGIRWPGEAGSAIRLAHDRSMLETEWASILKPWTAR